MDKNYVITIGREFGSGGLEIGEKLGKILGIKCYDKELINMVAKDNGLDLDSVVKADEKKAHPLFNPGGHFAFSSSHNDLPAFGTFGNTYNDKMYIAEAEIIREVAEKESCIIVGRCADAILRDKNNLLKIFIQAPMTDRISRTAEKLNITPSAAEKEIKRIDKIRSSYYKYYTDDKWGGRLSKDFVINSSYLGIDGTVEFIKTIVDSRFK